MLSHELMKAQENERLRISHELHDHVAQDLASLKIQMDTLFDRQKGVSQKAVKRASDISEMLRKIIAAVRDMAYDLRPPLLDQFGLVRTISGYCEDFSLANDIDIDFTHDGIPNGRFDFDTEINLYRLVQEGLNNIKKHAEARHTAVDMVLTAPQIFLSIEDDGKGFDVEKMLGSPQNQKRMGLRNMKERVNLLGGEMRIQSRPAEGTRIFIKVPVKALESPPPLLNEGETQIS
jgi:signal transduction histidine kinase